MQRNQQWKHKVQELFQSAQTEIKRTTEIGMKMFNATRTSSNLNEAYEELGMLAAKALERGDLEWNHARVKELLLIIKTCNEDLAKMEDEVNDIKFAEETVQAEQSKEVKSEVKAPEAKTSESDKPKNN